MQFFKKPANDSSQTLLLDDLKKTKNELDVAYSNLSNVVEPDLIDSWIYQIKAAQSRYNFLLRQAKTGDFS